MCDSIFVMLSVIISPFPVIKPVDCPNVMLSSMIIRPLFVIVAYNVQFLSVRFPLLTLPSFISLLVNIMFPVYVDT